MATPDQSLIDPVPMAREGRTGNPAHPRQGEAARSRREKVARIDAERALIILLGRDQVLAQVARQTGDLDRALAVAETYGFNPESYVEGRETALAQVRQSSRVLSGDFGPDHHPAVMHLINTGAPMEQIQQARQKIRQHQAAVARAAAEKERREAGPATPLAKQISVVNPALSSWGAEHDERVVAAILAVNPCLRSRRSAAR